MSLDSAATPFSLIALNRIVEERAAADPKFRRDLERRGRSVLSHARTLSDEALLEKLHRVGIEIDKNSYAEIAEHALSAEEIFNTAMTSEVRARCRERFAEDWVWFALTVLWERWYPQWPNFEQLDDQMQAGYARLTGDGPGACEQWLAAWEDFRLMFDAGNFKSLVEFDEAFRGSEFVANWVGDLEAELGNAALGDAKWHGRRIQFCEEFLRQFPEADPLTRENMRRALATATFETEGHARADALYEQWLQADPQWGWGWIGWGDIYWLTDTAVNRDLPRAEALWKQGLSVPEVRDRADILERLGNLCTEQGRLEEAAAFRRESESVRTGGRSFSPRTGFDFGETGVSTEQPPAVAVPAVSRKIGRNDPCPCGSGKKYKKCCLPKDEAAARERAKATQVTPSLLRDEAPIPAAPPVALPDLPPDWDGRALGEVTLPTEIERRVDELWTEFEELPKPTMEQMDTFLGRLLELPTEATDWGELLHQFARAGHADLPAVFRRIAGNLAHTPEAAMAYYYWGAAEVMSQRGHQQLLPEVAAGFQKLDLESYNPDALWHLLDCLLAEGFEAETLALAEHFLPILRADDDLIGYTVVETCNLIFELRVGAHLRDDTNSAPEVKRLAEELRRDLEEDVHPDTALAAAAVIADRAPAPPWSRAEFEFLKGSIKEGTKAWEDCMRLVRAAVQVAREAWRSEQRSPGGALHGLSLMLNSVYNELDSGGKKSKKASRNLLDYLLPAGLESRLVHSCRDIIGVNEPRARLLLAGHEVLLRFATRQQLLSEPDLARSRQNLDRLKEQLDKATGVSQTQPNATPLLKNEP